MFTFDEMRLNEIGEIVGAGWTGLPDHCRNIELDESIVMPNHLYGIAVIVREPALTAMTRMDMEGEPQPCASQI